MRSGLADVRLQVSRALGTSLIVDAGASSGRVTCPKCPCGKSRRPSADGAKFPRLRPPTLVTLSMELDYNSLWGIVKLKQMPSSGAP